MARFFPQTLFTIVAVAVSVMLSSAAVLPRDTAVADTQTIHVTSIGFPAQNISHSSENIGRDVNSESAWSTYFGNSDGSYVTGACGVAYSSFSHGACVNSAEWCGHDIYAYIGDGVSPTFDIQVTVVDVCSSLGFDELFVTIDAFEELGGYAGGPSLENVNWKIID